VWSVLIDVERWPEWTASVTKLERLDEAAFGLGSRVRIRQPKLGTTDWLVSEFEQGRLFSLQMKSVGGSTVGRHAVQPSEHGCTVTLTIDQNGWLAWLLRPFLVGLTRSYVQIEAQGLKKRCEQLAAV